MVTTLTLAASLSAALVALRERYGVSPIMAAQGTTAPFAGQAARTHVARTHAALGNVARKADDRFRPRGRRL